MYGNKLKEIRKHFSATQEEMAFLMNISYRAYTSYERSENNPPYPFLAVLCKKYKVNLNWFIADEGRMFNAKSEDSYDAVKNRLMIDVKNMLISEGVIK